MDSRICYACAINMRNVQGFLVNGCLMVVRASVRIDTLAYDVTSSNCTLTEVKGRPLIGWELCVAHYPLFDLSDGGLCKGSIIDSEYISYQWQTLVFSCEISKTLCVSFNNSVVAHCHLHGELLWQKDPDEGVPNFRSQSLQLNQMTRPMRYSYCS